MNEIRAIVAEILNILKSHGAIPVYISKSVGSTKSQFNGAVWRVSGSFNFVFALSKMAPLKQTPINCYGHTRPITQLAFSGCTPFGYFLISAAKEPTPMLRQGDTGDWIGTFMGHKGALYGCVLDAEAVKAATASGDYTAKVWDAVSGELLLSFNHKHIVKSVDFSMNTSLLLTGGNEHLARVFDLNKPEADPVMIEVSDKPLKTCLFSSDGKHLICTSEDKTISLWDRASAEKVRSRTFSHVPTVELSFDGQLLTVGHGKELSFLNPDSLEEVNTFEVPTVLEAASLHPDKHTVVCGGEDFKVYKINAKSGEQIDVYGCHFGAIHCVRFSPDGELFGTGSEDGTLRLWQTTVGKTYGLWKCIVPTNNQT